MQTFFCKSLNIENNLSNLSKIYTCVVFIIHNLYISVFGLTNRKHVIGILLLLPLLKIRTNIHDQRCLDPVCFIFDTYLFVYV